MVRGQWWGLTCETAQRVAAAAQAATALQATHRRLLS